MLRRGNCLICWRIRLFFPPQLRVGIQGVAWPLPDVVQAVQFAAQRVDRDVLAALTLQVRSEQANGPLGGGIGKILRRMLEELEQMVAVLLSQEVRTTTAVRITQDVGIMALAISRDPGIDDTGSHPQASRHADNGLSEGHFEDGQCTAIHTGIHSVPQLPFQAAPLPGGQRQGCHGGLLYLKGIR
jgi:hypothetical protein